MNSSMKTNGPGLRRRSRELALQLLFQTEFLSKAGDQGFDPAKARETFARFAADFEIEAETADYGGQLFMGVASQLKEIDSLIQSHSSHWKVSRMGLVDLSVMRICVFEMKFMTPQIPPGVAIDEAVEIAKIYGSTESSSFVNGILDQVAKSV